MLQKYDYYLNHARKMGEMFYKVSYNQGFCSLLGLGRLLKKSHNTRLIGLGIVTLLSLLYEFTRYSLLSTSIRSRESHRCGRGR